MISQMKRGEDIEHYADKHEERKDVMRREALLDAIDVVDSQGNWIVGDALDDFGFSAKVYPESDANYGITSHGADGLISKLTVKKGEKVVFNYDRGYDESEIPVTDEADIIQAIELYVKRNSDQIF